MMSVSHAAVSGEMARTPSCFDESNSTFPSYVVIFDTKSGSWRMPPLAIVDATVAISSGVLLIAPSVSVSTGVSVSCLMPILCAVSITFGNPTASSVRAVTRS